jgi:hypothetical protein
VKSPEIKDILAASKTEVFTIDPQHRNDITRATLLAMERAVKKSIAAKNIVKIIVASQ